MYSTCYTISRAENGADTETEPTLAAGHIDFDGYGNGYNGSGNDINIHKDNEKKHGHVQDGRRRQGCDTSKGRRGQ